MAKEVSKKIAAKRRIIRVFILCFFAAIFFPALTSGQFSEIEEEEGQLERPFGRFGPYARQLDFKAAEELGTREIERKGQWMLEPTTFEILSAAGKRVALLSNDLLPLPEESEQVRSFGHKKFQKQVKSSNNIRVNNPRLDTTLHTQSESSIAVNGSNIIVSFNDLNNNASAYAFSANGGKKFVQRRIPTVPGGINLGDGVVAFGPNGEIYYSTLAFINGRSIIAVAKSTNKGKTFTTPVDASTTASNPRDVQDKEWLVVDTTNSPFRGNIYVSWTHFTFVASFINFSRSTDGGRTFEAPLMLSPMDGDFIVQGSMPAVAPNGDLYIAYFDTHIIPAGISLVKSLDGGKSFSSPRVAARLNLIGTVTGGNTVRTNSNPSIVVDSNGAIHIVYAAVPAASGPDRSDIFYVRSTDGGNNFSRPQKLNDDDTSTTQFLPSIAAAANGTLAVKWWDRRNDPAKDSLTDVYMSISNNGGDNFNKNFRITDHNWVFGPSENGSYHGDYDDLKADANTFFVSWSDERNGDPDVYLAQIPINLDPNLPDFNISATNLYDGVVAGNSVNFDFSSNSSNGFKENIKLRASPIISGINYNFTSATIAAGQPAKLTISTTNRVTPGDYLITVTGTSSKLNRKTSFRLNVLDPKRSTVPSINITRSRGFSTAGTDGLKIDSSGTVHVTFVDDSDNILGSDVFYSQSVDGGKTYLPPVKVSADKMIAFSSALALDDTGNIYITWATMSDSQLKATVFISKSADSGKTFSPPLTLSTPSQIADLPSVAVDRSGNILVTFNDFAARNPQLFAARSVDGGISFSNPIQISKSSQFVNGIAYAAFDSKGAAYVVYNDIITSTPMINLAITADGKAFSSTKITLADNSFAFSPHIAIDKDDNIYVTFYNQTGKLATVNRDVIIIKSTDRGNSFGPQLNITNNAGQSTFPYLILDNRGNVNVLWQDTTGSRVGNEDILLARSTNGGRTFGKPINLSNNGGKSVGVFGAADKSGNLLITWTDDSSANNEVFVGFINLQSLGASD
jgi:hypothetical protein